MMINIESSTSLKMVSEVGDSLAIQNEDNKLEDIFASISNDELTNGGQI